MSDEREEAEEARERQRRHQQHLNQLQFNDDGELSADFVETMCDTDTLQDGTVDLLQSYLSKQWILSNLTKGRENDIFYKLAVAEMKLKSQHPPTESAIQGETRAHLLNDPHADLHALSPRERQEVESFFDSVRFAILGRSRDGFERKQMVTQVRESQTRRNDLAESSSSGGTFGGLF